MSCVKRYLDDLEDDLRDQLDQAQLEALDDMEDTNDEPA